MNPAAAPPATKGWWSRNETWLLVAGIVLGLSILGYGGWRFATGLIDLMRNAEPYRHAMVVARQDARVVAALGEPIEDARFFTGRISASGTSARASYAIPLQGPNGRGVLQVQARRDGAAWSYPVLVVVVEDGKDIDLAGAR